MTWKILALFSAGAMLVCAESDAAKRLDAAAQAFREVMDTPDKTIPQDLLNKAHCVVVIPGLKTGAFIVGGKYGKGFVACRKAGGVGWTGPAAVRVEGGSFGFQIGGTETDLFMLVMNDGGMKRLLTSKFTLGGDASAAAGPVGRETQAQTDAMMTAEILTWSRAKGLFAGISLQGATLRTDEDWDKELYGRPITNREILRGGIAAPPAAARFEAELNKYSSRK
ncbi:MAG TPA: lipid-binding SYLF domain-containing protein [Bryobacteraceae bacterium]|nr:lipid-binding SYLF domain-containing protein [Bryobacteraceae bacterium]